MTKGRPVIAAKAAIQESLGLGQGPYWNAYRDVGAGLEPGSAPSWIAAFAAMTKGVAARSPFESPQGERRAWDSRDERRTWDWNSLGMAKGRPVIAAKAAIQKSPGLGQASYCSVYRDAGAGLEPCSAPSWIAAFAAMTKGVAARSPFESPQDERRAWDSRDERRAWDWNSVGVAKGRPVIAA